MRDVDSVGGGARYRDLRARRHPIPTLWDHHPRELELPSHVNINVFNVMSDPSSPTNEDGRADEDDFLGRKCAFAAARSEDVSGI